MMRYILLAASLAMTVPAGAEKPVYGQAADDLSIQAIHNFAACVADHAPRGAIELLQLDYRSPEHEKHLRRLAQGTADHCAPASRGRFTGVLLDGGIAERLLIEKIRPDRFPGLVAYDSALPPIVAPSVIDRVAICVARAEPAKTFAIFQTEPTGREEVAALNAIGPALSNCIPGGQKIAFNRQGVRAMLALASYRLTQPRPVVSPDAKPVLGSIAQ